MTFFQTAGGRTGVPAPRRVRRAPYVQFSAPLAWTTLALTLRADGSSSFALTGASSFPRHWVYDGEDKLALKSGMIDFSNWYRRAFGKHSPWGDRDSQALTTEVETALERQLSLTLMQGGAKPKVKTFKAGTVITEQGAAEDDLYLVLDGVVRIEVDGERLAEYGPGSMHGERAVLEGGQPHLDDPGRHGVQARRGLGRRHRPRRPGAAEQRAPAGGPELVVTVAVAARAARLGRPAMDDVDAVVIGSGPNGLVAAALLARAGWSVHRARARRGGRVAPCTAASSPCPATCTTPTPPSTGCCTARRCWPSSGSTAPSSGRTSPSPWPPRCRPTSTARVRRDPQRHRRRALGRGRRPTGRPGSSCTGGGARSGASSWTRCSAPSARRGPGSPSPAAPGARASSTPPSSWWARSRRCAPSASPTPPPRRCSPRARPTPMCPSTIPAALPPPIILALAAQQLGMPVPVGGARRLAAALADAVTDAGGVVRTATEVTRVVVEPNRVTGVETADGGARARPSGRARRHRARARCSTASWATDLLPARFLAGLRRFRYGTGVFKVDLALDGPAPWAAPGLAEAGVVHLTGDLDAMARAAHEARRGTVPGQPMLIVGQQTVADPSRAPAGGHTLWIETHVPPVPRAGGSWATATRRLPRRGHGPSRGARPGARVAGGGHGGAHPRGPRAREPQPGGRRPRGGLVVARPAARVPARAGVVPLRHPGQGPLPVLGLDAPRRRRPRHGRAQLRPAGALGPAPAPDLSTRRTSTHRLAPPRGWGRAPLTLARRDRAK